MLKRVIIKNFKEEKCQELFFSSVFSIQNLIEIPQNSLSDFFVFHPFEVTKNKIIVGEVNSIKPFLIDRKNSGKYLPEKSTGISKEEYTLKITSLINEIKSKKYQKVVFSRKISFDITSPEVENIFIELTNEYKNAYCYLVELNNGHSWLGATPEQLIKCNTMQNCEVVSLAGTKRIDSDEASSWGNKEKQEQLVVTDFIVKNLIALSINPKIGNVKEVNAGKLKHLKTTISFTLNSSEKLLKIINSLHPTPAVCGIPKEKSKNYILNNEEYNREYYTGFLGLINLKKINCNLVVNLRCMKVVSNKTHIFVGAGITSDSNPLDEWYETENKSYTLRKILEK